MLLSEGHAQIWFPDYRVKWKVVDLAGVEPASITSAIRTSNMLMVVRHGGPFRRANSFLLTSTTHCGSAVRPLVPGL